MAVQAQYPSNILLLNRNGQERKNMLGGDYSSLQAQVSGFLDQSSPILFDNGAGAHPRKRGREAIDAAAAVPISFFSLQPPPPQASTLINLAQLHNQQSKNMVSTGLRLSFEDQHHQNQQTNLLAPSPVISSLSNDLTEQIKQQRDEIDQFLQTQGDQLRRTLAETRQRHYRALFGAAEESAARRLKGKDAELEKAARVHAGLEERVAYLKAEAHVWQSKARAHEATAASLQAQLQQAMMARGAAQDKREEVGCAGGEMPADDAESAHIDPDRPVSVPLCRACRKRGMSVVLLPCRHLCVCTDCDAAVDACPVCRCVRSASVEVYLA